MPTLHLTRGLPGSGKSTFARAWVAEDPSHRVRVNRDDVRALLHAPYAGRPTEQATTLACHSSLRTLLRKGWDVICDDTNLNAANTKNLMNIAKQVGADVEFHDFPINVEAAIQRDAARTQPVGADVIRRMHERYLAQHKGGMPPVPALPVTPKFEPYVPVVGTPKAVIVDVDGTLARNYGHRSFYDYSRVCDDAVRQPIADLLWHFIDQGFIPIIMSGRDDSCRDDTETWLFDKLGLLAQGQGALGDERDYIGPLMRATGDKRDDAIVKLELFNEHVRDHYDVRYVLDDRDRVVRAWRSIGLTCLQVADGNF